MYITPTHVRRHILRQTDEEILEQDKLIKSEIESGAIPDPAMQAEFGMGGEGGAPIPAAGGGPTGGDALAGAPKDPETPEAPETPAGSKKNPEGGII